MCSPHVSLSPTIGSSQPIPVPCPLEAEPCQSYSVHYLYSYKHSNWWQRFIHLSSLFLYVGVRPSQHIGKPYMPMQRLQSSSNDCKLKFQMHPWCSSLGKKLPVLPKVKPFSGPLEASLVSSQMTKDKPW